jgi:transposase-like protein
MNIQTVYPIPRVSKPSRPNCPQCGSTLLIAEQSAFSLDGRIRHSWSCDACGQEFTTSVRILPRQA